MNLPTWGSRSRALLLLAPLVLSLLCAADVRGQEIHGADAVVSFSPADAGGYGSDHFPGNVLGRPDSSARPEIPATDPRQVLALGLGGEIVLRFDGAPIVDAPGPDIAVFENPFRYRRGAYDRVYAEPAEVAVSSDGVIWYPFPYDSTTLAGCAGTTPTDGSYSPLDERGGGDRFDLATLGLAGYGIASVRYVRLRDVTAIVRGYPDHPFYDFTLNGFDLDAVVNLSTRPAAAVAREESVCSLHPPLSTDGFATLRIGAEGYLRCRLFDLTGHLIGEVYSGRVNGEVRIPLRATAGGVYLVRIERENAPPLTLRWSVMR